MTSKIFTTSSGIPGGAEGEMAGFLDLFSIFFKPRPVKAVGERLYAACVTQARQPGFYTAYGVADEIGARFELVTLHVVMAVSVLKAEKSEQADETAQALFDAFLLELDSNLRERGIGDVSVPKKMKQLARVVYTRLDRWSTFWRDQAESAALADYVARTIYADGDEAQISAATGLKAAALTAYIEAARRSLRPEDLLEGRTVWPLPAGVDAA